jgi:tyrosinase
MQANVERMAAGSVALRKSIYSLTEEELGSYREAIQKMMDRSDSKGYNYLAGIHGVPQGLCVHHQWPWLAWHRVYLYLFEQNLQDQVPGVTIPWWDWTSSDTHTNGLPQAFTAVSDSNGNPNPLLRSSISVLNPKPLWPTETHRSQKPPNSPELPTADQVNICGSIPFFNSDPTGFSEQLAGLHDNLHDWVGGEMGNPAWAAYDPIFWSHHCMIDRLWYLWQIAPSNASFVWDPSQLATALSVPGTTFTVGDILDISKLGYGYAAAEATALEVDG